MAVPNIFGTATAAIPLSQLDQNFATAITLGNTAVYLGNTTTSLGNVTLTNVTISSGNVTVSNITANAVTSPAATNLLLQSAGTTAVTIDTSQNVGIGTASPLAKLQTDSSSATYSANIRARNSNFGNGVVGAASGILTVATDMNNMAFYTGSNLGVDGTSVPTNERMRLNSTGALVLAGGSTSANGVGITFPATQSASSNANTLDDYEEGTWTPSINPASGTVTSSVVAGTYVKVGRQVTLNYSAQITGGTITSVSSIGGFPFAVQSDAVAGSGSCREFYASGLLWSLTVGAGATAANLIKYDNTSACSNIFAWSGTLTYQTTT